VPDGCRQIIKIFDVIIRDHDYVTGIGPPPLAGDKRRSPPISKNDVGLLITAIGRQAPRNATERARIVWRCVIEHLAKPAVVKFTRCG
jgi:hypothetical protein